MPRAITPALKTTHSIVTAPVSSETNFSHTVTLTRSVILNKNHDTVQIWAKIDDTMSGVTVSQGLNVKDLNLN